MLQIPDYPFRAFIFDCDGTLVDSMPLHYEAWLGSLKIHQAPFDFSEEYFYSTAGIPEVDVVRHLNGQYGTRIDPHAVSHTKSELFLSRLEEVKEVRPVAEFARSIHGRYPMAVASGSEEPVVRRCLQANGLLDLFPVIITPRNVARGKPAPDMFLLAAEQLGAEPSECLVLEDGQPGVEAAKAAGMQWLFIPRSLR